MADGCGTGSGDVDEKRNQMMQNIFGDENESEEKVVEEEVDQADDDDTGASGGDRGPGGGGGGEQQQNRLSPPPAAAEDEHELDKGHDGDEWEEVQGERQGSGGMAQEIESDAHDTELGNQSTQGHRKGVTTVEGNHVKRTVTNEIRSIEDYKDHEVVHNVFGNDDEDEFAPYGAQDDNEDAHGSLMNDEGHYEELQSEGMLHEDKHYELEGNIEHQMKDKPLGPPLNLVVPHMLPPGQPDRMNVIKVSNIMGVNPKPFDPETYVEEDASMTDESGGRKKIQLKDNVVRWRISKNDDGTESYESNARFVKWKDGSMQLLIGNEVLDMSVNESNHDNSHLFLRNGKGLMQSQGRLLQKMRCMPSSLSSRSHRSLTALVNSQNKKTIKMQTWIDEKDPEKVKEEKEKAEEENIRANSSLQRKREQVKRKYQKQKLTPVFLEDALDEDDARGVGYNWHQGPDRAHLVDDLEVEARSEGRATTVKENVGKAVSSADVPRHQANEYSESEKEESELETDVKDIDNSPTNGREEDLEEEEEEDPEEVIGDNSMSDENNEEQEHVNKHKGIDSDNESPPRKPPVNRRKIVVFDSDDE
ncbi:protein LEO1 homolog [Oryza brachyantha]|uniref:protein LEO1 homolog n=1 Tax=Oryza brachyantha TaxID=4533 RepID=UPI001ADCEBB4|nr:protein LEO1 homolog [Oryza brachyantha]